MLDLIIPHDSLASLLAAVRTHASPARPTHIPALRPLRPHDILHVQGPPASAKSHLLYHFLITCILPFRHGSTTLDGWQSLAVVFDTDMSFDIRRFHVLLCARLKRLLPHVNEPAVQSLARDALKRLHIFQPKSSAQLAATIYHLPKYLANHLSNRQIGLVGIDSISAFHWPDRFTAQQMQIAGEGAYVHPLSHVFTALRSLHLHYSPIIVLTNWGLIPDPEYSISSIPVFKQHLHPFPGSCSSAVHASDDSFKITCHITLAPYAVTHKHQCTAKTEEKINRNSKGEIIAAIQYPGNSDVNTFNLEIYENDMVVL